MKSTLLILFFLVSLTIANAQVKKTEDITTVWPFIYEDFVDGTIFYNQGSKIDAKVNIDLVRYKLNFFDTDDIVKEFSISMNIDSVVAGFDTFIPIENVFYEVLASENKHYLLKKIKADISHLGAQGGYGSATSSAAVTQYTELYVSSFQHLPISHMKFDINAGESIPTGISYWIYDKQDENLFRITKKSLKTEFAAKNSKSFIKSNKIKLNQEEDQFKLFHFLMQ